MALPDISKTRLQRTINDVEFDVTFSDFSEMCVAVSDTDWAKGLGLTSDQIANLIFGHDVKTKTARPSAPPPLPVDPEETAEPDAPAAATGPKEVKVFDEPGRGRKQCPKCQKIIGVRTGVCICGHTFNGPAEKTPKREVVQAPVPQSQPEVSHISAVARRGNGMMISTPNEPPPAKLTGDSAEEVEEWISKCQDYGERRRVSYLPSALIYWVEYNFYSRTKVDQRESFFKVQRHILTICTTTPA